MIWPLLVFLLVVVIVSLYANRYTYFVSIRHQGENYHVKGFWGIARFSFNSKRIICCRKVGIYLGGFSVMRRGIFNPHMGVVLPGDEIYVVDLDDGSSFSISRALCERATPDLAERLKGLEKSTQNES